MAPASFQFEATLTDAFETYCCTLQSITTTETSLHHYQISHLLHHALPTQHLRGHHLDCTGRRG